MTRFGSVIQLIFSQSCGSELRLVKGGITESKARQVVDQHTPWSDSSKLLRVCQLVKVFVDFVNNRINSTAPFRT
ncbi:hypothetical protein E2C01_068100 [Portunus trituberculatus]|uniref:Uncharacterized protein n=1 Tax=Portunus trituberculatus TaxID=210409 RepID=A0A5B7HUW5_PORTR|nr:hypothetical protein [Portunus trituberculatus]